MSQKSLSVSKRPFFFILSPANAIASEILRKFAMPSFLRFYSFIQRPRPANQGRICYFDPVNSVLIRYHEIALKKGNRPYFVDLLKRNLIASLRDLKLREAKTLQARILLTFDS